MGSELQLEVTKIEDLNSEMNWLVNRPQAIEQNLAQQHLIESRSALFSIYCSYNSCDDNHSRSILVCGLMTDRQRRPASIRVWLGYICDLVNFPVQVVEKLRNDLQLEQVVLGGCRGVRNQAVLNTIRDDSGLVWVSELNDQQVCSLRDSIRGSLFDQRNLVEIKHQENFPGERFIACRNPIQTARRIFTK